MSSLGSVTFQIILYLWLTEDALNWAPNIHNKKTLSFIFMLVVGIFQKLFFWNESNHFT